MLVNLVCLTRWGSRKSKYSGLCYAYCTMLCNRLSNELLPALFAGFCKTYSRGRFLSEENLPEVLSSYFWGSRVAYEMQVVSSSTSCYIYSIPAHQLFLCDSLGVLLVILRGLSCSTSWGMINCRSRVPILVEKEGPASRDSNFFIWFRGSLQSHPPEQTWQWMARCQMLVCQYPSYSVPCFI